MTVKLVKTEEGYYLIDGSEIKVDSYYLAWETNYNTPKWVRYVLCSGLNGTKQYNIVASTLDLEGVNKLSIKNCQAIANGYDLDELALYAYEPETSVNHSAMYKYLAIRFFKQGFQKAVEILGDKKFSEEDMVQLVKSSFYAGLSKGQGKNQDFNIDDYVKEHLQQTEWEVEIEMESINIGAVSSCFHPKDFETKIPKLDSDGCLILKRK